MYLFSKHSSSKWQRFSNALFCDTWGKKWLGLKMYSLKASWDSDSCCLRQRLGILLEKQRTTLDLLRKLTVVKGIFASLHSINDVIVLFENMSYSRVN